jgi:alkyldihydroxyacetonephosphate synthase
MRWWGWGDPAHRGGLPAGALRFLQQTIELDRQIKGPVQIERVSLPQAALGDRLADSLRAILGSEFVREDHLSRLLHAAGKGYPDLVRMRAGEPQQAPDAVLYPQTHTQLEAVLSHCAEQNVAVVPFGGGTSVVGGLTPVRQAHAAVVSLDLSALSQVLGIDRRSALVRVQGGLKVRALERKLAAEGLTLGHFPQSYEYVSVGGCAATRSAGQASTGYGRFEDMVRGLCLATPNQSVSLPASPASAAGPSVRELIVGSEGTLGVISELTLRVRQAPSAWTYEGVMFEDLDAGMQALCELAQRRCAPAVSRLSDQAETRVALALSSGGPLKRIVGETYLRLRGYRSGCLAIFGFPHDTSDHRRKRREAHRLISRRGGRWLGRAAGQAWAASRFSAPYLRDDLLAHGVMVDTLETATTWSALSALHRDVSRAISDALRAQGTPGLVMCHVSHLYETGASLYFTFLAPAKRSAPLAQWLEVKRAASEAIVNGQATITHHHGVGSDHMPWLEHELSARGLAALWALKRELDPAGIMNPGKLYPTIGASAG